MIPVHDLQAEAAVISAVLLASTPQGSEPGALAVAREILDARAFFSRAHREIFMACCDLADSGSPVDVVLVATRLRNIERIPQVGGMAYLTQVLNAAPAVTHVAAYCEVVAGHARTRRLVRTLRRALNELQHGRDADNVIPKMNSEIDAIIAQGEA